MNSDNDIERLRDALYPNPLENTQIRIICQNCGEYLYDGDTYYPDLGVCEYCLQDYKEIVDIPLEEDPMTVAHRIMEED